ncbi:N-acetylmuramoyl-L-alanine amidase [Schaalia hyovaginalis]|uniref:N-acetylmuramoyl-L-alanine amidase n=1 Tax=Schaalia hyovaginalis TaxID=29316 RepID=UPI001F3494C9|nr:N-acetylmuramoyl-L-alanine amidase [Schaalia hyovaginalis]MCF2711223.1 N-acetylmuramoyl-L-alanine amidase [Schaalia hyovaginalis]
MASSIGSILIASLVFGASAPARSAQPSDPQSPQPIQAIRLTDAQGEPTEVGESALVPVEVGVGRGTKPMARSGLWRTKDGFDPGEGARLLTEPLAVDPYMVTGLTWRGGMGEASTASVLIRVREDSVWSDWYLLEADESGGREGERATFGTDPFVTAGADGIQVLMSGSGELPADLSIELVPSHPEGREVLTADEVETTTANATGLDPASITAGEDPELKEVLAEANQSAPANALPPSETGAEPDDRSDPASPRTTTSGAIAGGMSVNGRLKGILPAATTANGLPVPVVTRSEWGAGASSGGWTPEYVHAPFVVVHHTAGTNNYTCAQSADIVRGIYSYHANSLRWGDIGYNILVDKCGTAFEGRYGTLSSPKGSMVVAGHSYGFNSGTMGISLLGEYTSTVPSAASLSTVGKLAGWQLRRAGVSPTSTGVFISQGNSKYPQGTRVNLPRISGHRDNGYTACPGDAVYSRMGTIRSIAEGGTSIAADPGVSSPESPAQLTGKGTWILESDRWRWLNSDGSYAADTWASINGSTYYFGVDSIMHEGWLALGSQWYYLTPSSGALARGLLRLADGAYDLGTSGAMRTGWVKYSNGWRYYDDSGRQASGWRMVSAFWYYLEPSTGIMKTGWFTSRGSTYYLDPATGAMAASWKTINGQRHYFDPTSGALLKGGFVTISGDRYYLDPASGAARLGWMRIGSTWYYFDPSTAAMRTGWLLDRNTWYYLTPGTGAMRTGWLLDRNTWYYLTPGTGAMHTGWLLDRNTWYYLTPGTGAMVTGAQSVNGTRYIFNASGALR